MGAKAQGPQGLDVVFARLQSQLEGRQFKKALKTCEEVLKADGSDRDAVQCKASLLIELGRFDEALTFLEEHSSHALPLHKAYCLYRNGSFKEALQACTAVPDDQAAAKAHLHAQLQYRLGNHQEAIRIYEDLASKRGALQDAGANLAAAYVAAGRSADLPKAAAALKLAPRASFEVAFNFGCALLAQGDLKAARQQLLHAQRLGREELLDQEFEGAELDAELATVTLQLALVAVRQGRLQEAEESFKALAQLPGLEEEAAAVLQNNGFALSMAAGQQPSRKALGELRKRAESSFLLNASKLQIADKLQRRLSQGQQQALLTNHALLLLAAGQKDACAAMMSALQARWPQSLQVALVAAGTAAASGDSAKAKALLEAARQQAPAAEDASEQGQAAWAPLMLAQLEAQEGRFQQASAALEEASSRGLQSEPALIASRVAAIDAAGNTSSATAAAEAALQRVGASKGQQSADAQQWLLQRLADLQLKAGETGKAMATFQQLQSAGGADTPDALRTLGMLVKAGISQPGAIRDKSLAGLKSHLKPLEALEPAELDQLEAALPGASASRRRAAQPMDADQPAAKRRRKRKPRLPKDFDAENPGPMPDPERWLPKWQRAGFKRKRLRRREKEAQAAKGSQGAGKVDESLDRSRASADLDAAPSKPALPAGQGKKKKGRN